MTWFVETVASKAVAVAEAWPAVTLIETEGPYAVPVVEA
jgi:hypothetical protein